MKLRFSHWRTGPTEREVERLRGTANLYHDGFIIYQLSLMTGSVHLAGAWNFDKPPKFTEPVPIGDDGLIIELRAAKRHYGEGGDAIVVEFPCHAALGHLSTPIDGETARAVDRPIFFERATLDDAGDWA